MCLTENRIFKILVVRHRQNLLRTGECPSCNAFPYSTTRRFSPAEYEPYSSIESYSCSQTSMQYWRLMRFRYQIAALIFFALLASRTFAHEVRPAYLELTQTGPETHDMLWKVPGLQDMRLGIYVRLPENCAETNTRRSSLIGGSYVDRVSIRCKGGLAGRVIAIDGLSATLTDVLVRVQHSDGTSQTARLTPGVPAFTVAAVADWKQKAVTYLNLGITHIALGFDHLMFVLGLLILVGRRWKLLFKTITSFTLAHSLTLAAATLGILNVPGEPLNAVIALSILFLGLEVMRKVRGAMSFTIEHPWVAAFGFGLVHGLGFATGLSTLGLPAPEIAGALLFFNVGVEVGQISFVAMYYLFLRSMQILEVWAPRWTPVLPAYTIGAVGAYWTIAYTLKMFYG